MPEPLPLAQTDWRRLRRWLRATGVGLVLACLAVTWVQWRQVSMVASAANESTDKLVWRVFQLEGAFLQLRDQLRVVQMEPTDPVRDHLARRARECFAMLAEQLAQVQPIAAGPAPAATATPPIPPALGLRHATTLADLQHVVRKHQAVLGAAASQPLTRQAAVAALADLSNLQEPVRAMTVQANAAEAEAARQRNAAVHAQSRLSIALTLLQTLLTGAFALLSWRQFRSLVQRRRDLQQVADRLREARAEAEAASQAKSAFLANMSHELRTPFNGMLGMLALLDNDRLDAEQADYLRTARESANHLLDLLNDILDISKLESGRLAIVPQSLDMHRLLRDVHGLMALSAEAKQLALRVHVAPELPQWVLADGKRLKQILFNLMSNAVKFTDAGEVSLTVSTRPAPADALGAEPMHELRFVVRDTGIGMNDAMRARLFQRFSQGDLGTARRFGGTGLGLEISRSLARMMGGDITVDSKPGMGSVFTLSLDLPGAAPGDDAAGLADDGPALQLPAPPADGADGEGLDLVVADDHPVNRKFMRILLRRMGHRVRLAGNGAEAVALVAEQVPDLVFMDLHMPVQDGLEATRILRAGPPAMARVPVVALTADAFADTRARVLQAGMNRFLAKPVQPDEIEALLTALFGARARGPAPEGTDFIDSSPAPLMPPAPPGMTSAAVGVPAPTPSRAAPPTEPAAMRTTPSPAAPPVPAAPSAGGERRRFRTSDVAAHLDMTVIGDVCVGVSLAGYQSVLTGFLDDEGGSAANLLAALDRGDAAGLKPLAHAVKGASASMGLRALNSLALAIEREGAGYDAAACAATATQLREHLLTARALLQRMGFLRG